MSLTPQQLRFVEAYALCLNATRAATEAGYSKKTARQQGSRLLTHVDIQSEIKKLLTHSGLSAEEIAARWDRIATVDLSDFYSKVKVEHTPRVEKKLAKIVEEYRAHVEFEQALAIRSEELITDRKARERHRKAEQRKHLQREQHLLRLEMELEQEPSATRIAAGPTVLRDKLRLDLVKAEALGLLDLVKSTTETKFGTGITLRDPDDALGNLAKWRGMTTKLDLTSGGESLAPPPLLGVLSLEQKKELLEKRRQLRAAQEGKPDA